MLIRNKDQSANGNELKPKDRESKKDDQLACFQINEYADEGGASNNNRAFCYKTKKFHSKKKETSAFPVSRMQYGLQRVLLDVRKHGEPMDLAMVGNKREPKNRSSSACLVSSLSNSGSHHEAKGIRSIRKISQIDLKIMEGSFSF